MSISSVQAHPWVYLDVPMALSQVGNVASLRRMLPMLQELLERDVPVIEQLLDKGDAMAAHPLLHALKGCMPIFCATALCEQLSHVEHLSKSVESAQVGAAYALLQPHLQALQLEISQYLALPA